MKIHSTNYTDTFIEIADDSPATQGEVPPLKTDKPPLRAGGLNWLAKTLTSLLILVVFPHQNIKNCFIRSNDRGNHISICLPTG